MGADAYLDKVDWDPFVDTVAGLARPAGLEEIERFESVEAFVKRYRHRFIWQRRSELVKQIHQLAQQAARVVTVAPADLPVSVYTHADWITTVEFKLRVPGLWQVQVFPLEAFAPPARLYTVVIRQAGQGLASVESGVMLHEFSDLADLHHRLSGEGLFIPILQHRFPDALAGRVVGMAIFLDEQGRTRHALFFA